MAKNTDLRKELLEADPIDTYTKFEIPVYILAGQYDYTVNYELQKEYYDKIEAPIKDFHLFDNSAHSTLWEEQEEVIAYLKDKLISNIR